MTDSRESGLRTAAALCFVDVMLIGTAAMMSNSLTLLSDLFKESADFAAVLAAFFTVRAVNRSPGERFSYGIGKLENLTSLGIAVMMVLCSGFILVQAVGHLSDPQTPHGTGPGIAVFLGYALIGSGFWLYNLRLLKRQASAIIESQARLWFSKAAFDLLMAITLILALVFSEATWSRYLDPIAALIGVGFMLHAAWSLTSSSVGDLLDATLEETLQLRILRQLAERFDDYDALHAVRTRRSGSRVFIEVHLGFDPELRMGDVQARIDSLRDGIAQDIPGADVSVLPASGPPPDPVAPGRAAA